MSGQETLQELDRIVATTNELLLSPEVKMMDVGGGVMRPTNAMVMTNLSTLLGGAMPYTSVADGLEKTVDGTNFSVLSSAQDEYVNVYRNENGSAVFVDSYPNKQAFVVIDGKVVDLTAQVDANEVVLGDTKQKVRDLGGQVDTDALSLRDVVQRAGRSNYLYAIGDDQGNTAFGIDANGRPMIQQEIYMGGMILRVVEDPNYAFALTDSAGNVLSGQLMDGAFIGSESSESAASLADARNLALRDQLPQIPMSVAWPSWDYSIFAKHGQSLAVSAEGWPALSKIAVDGTYMLGDATTPISFASASFSPFGGAALKPLVANVRSGSAILSDAEVAALPAGDQASGEDSSVAWLHGIRRQMARRARLSGGTPASLVTFSCGRGGESIEALSKGRSDGGTVYYDRYPSALTQIKALVDGLSKTSGVAAICWMQGEANYSGSTGGITTRAGYKAKLDTLVNDMQGDAQTLFAQAEKPLFYTYQTGAAFTRDADASGTPDLAIGMAQWELSRERVDVVMVGPTYHLTDKRDNTDNGHLDANGYRWFGEYLAKVSNFIYSTGRKWQPLSPVGVSITGSTVTIDFYVPVPPLRWQTIYDKTTAVNFTDKGFRVTDSAGALVVQSVNIIGQTQVQLNLDRVPDGASALLWYADKTTHLGGGNLCDSDASVGQSNYEYNAGSGQYPGDNIAELVGKPYPLRNACIAFCLPLNWSI